MASNLVRVKRHVLCLDNVYGTHCIEGEILWTWIWGQLHIFTARKRSLGQGNIFSSVCQEFCSRGARKYLGRYPPFEQVPPSGRYTPLWAGTPPGSSACWEIWATSGRYASYWNAFLLRFKCIYKVIENIHEILLWPRWRKCLKMRNCFAHCQWIWFIMLVYRDGAVLTWWDSHHALECETRQVAADLRGDGHSTRVDVLLHQVWTPRRLPH